MSGSFTPKLDTARSSTATAIEAAHNAQLASLESRLEQEIIRDEAAFESYGGDDPHEPPPRDIQSFSPPFSPTATLPPLPPPVPLPEKADPNKVTWDSDDDPENPQNWSYAYKWFVTMTCVVMTINVTFASSAPTSAIRVIGVHFHAADEVTYLLTTVFLLGYTFGPLFWGPGSELIGRRPIFVITLSAYTLFHIGQALAPNMQTLLITRFLSGFFAVAPLTNCGGVIADIWSAVGRGPATSIFTAATFMGPVIGPIVGGFIVQSSLSWRWLFWIMMIFAGVCTIFTIIFLPETYAPVLLLKKAKRIRKNDPSKSTIYAEHEKQDWSFKGLVHRTVYRPFEMLFMEPVLVLITIYLSLVYGVLYCLFEAFPIVYMARRHFTVAQDGLMFIGVGIGTTLGSLINYFLSRRYPELIKKWRGFPPAEQRLIGGMIGGPGLVIGAFWLGWTGEYSSIPWYVPGLSTIVIGMSISLIFMSFLSYLVDTYLMHSASAFAANTMIRSAVASAFPLFTVQMFTKMGINWACTVIGLVALVLAPSPFLFYKFGPQIRMRSKFAPCIDLKIAKLVEEEEAAARKEKEVA